MATNELPAGLTLQSVNSQIEALDRADDSIRRAEIAGMDMSAQKKAARETRQRLLKLKQAYFPGQ